VSLAAAAYHGFGGVAPMQELSLATMFRFIKSFAIGCFCSKALLRSLPIACAATALRHVGSDDAGATAFTVMEWGPCSMAKRLIKIPTSALVDA
jgi:hypothetical protein